jgi:hypothetical protein
VGKPISKRQLGRARHRWENNVHMNLKGIEWGDLKCINLVVIGTGERILWTLLGYIHFGKFLALMRNYWLGICTMVLL